MTLQLGSDTEARIHERIKSGKYATPNDVVLAGLELLEQREQTHATDMEELRKKIQHGIDQLDRGEGFDGETVMAELLANLEESRAGR